MNVASTLRLQRTSCTDCQRRSLRMFCNLSEEELADFDSLGQQVSMPRGALLFKEEEPCNNVAVVCSGQFKLSCTSREGKTLIIRMALPGDVIGLGAAFTNTHYEVTAEAAEPTTVRLIRKAEFIAFLERHGQASMHAARALSDEYKSAFFDARRLALAPTAGGRIAAVLLDWARSAACTEDQMRFTMALTHEEFANLAGTSRETVTRVLGRFQRDKVIQIRGASLTILDADRLTALT